jgi:HEAT repeat protein
MAMLLARSYERLRSHLPDLKEPVPPDRTEEVGEALLLLLREKRGDVNLCRDAALVLGDIQYTNAITTLIEIAQMDTTPSALKRACVNSLRHFRTEDSINALMNFLGIHVSMHDKWVRQLAAQHLMILIRRLRREDEVEAQKYVHELRTHYLNSANTYTRMNSAIVLRLLGDKEVLPVLETRLKKEQDILQKNPKDQGVPFVVRELEKAISALKDTAPPKE